MGGQVGARLSARGRRLRRRHSRLRRRHSRLVTLSHRLRRTARTGLTFFADISRSFHAPLALVTSPVGRLLRRGRLNRERQGVLRVIQGGITILLELVARVLSFRGCRRNGLTLQLSRFGTLRYVGS